MTEKSAPEDYEAFKRLGAGGHDDQLHFRLILRIFRRCLPLLGGQTLHLVLLLAGLSLLSVALLPAALLLIDTFWSRVLEAEPPTVLEARMLLLEPAVAAVAPPRPTLGPETAAALGLDPALAAAGWTPELRKAALRRVVALGLAISLVAMPGFLALFYYQIWILQRVNQTLRLRLHDRFQALSLRFHAESRVGDAIYRMYQDSAMVTRLIDVLFLTPLRALAYFLVSLLLVCLFDPWLGLLLFAAWPLAIALGARYSRPMRVGFRMAREANSALTSRIQETLTGIKVIKAYGAEAVEQGRFETDSRKAFAAAYVGRDRYAVFKVLTFWMLGALMVVATGIATARSVTAEPLYLPLVGLGVWSLGLYNFFKMQFGSGANGVRWLMALWGRAQDIAIGLDRVFEVLDLEPEVRDAPDAVPMPEFRSGIAFRGVSFRYEADRPILSNIDLEAGAGTITALVGPTGSGKSTLMALLLRLFDPDEGVIEIDGADIRGFTLESLRARIAIALQENVLFGTTVRENIRYAVPGASDAQVREAARVAGAAEFIEKLPQGYDTLLGERGTKLSTGQRQRISIARAVLKDTPILVLDEPTAALDAETELAVLSNLASWGRGRAIFLITHRLSTIRRADQVAYLHEGRLLERGPHGALMSREGGAYRGLVEAEEGRALAAAGAQG